MPNRAIVIALYVNAAALVAILLYLASGGQSMGSTAYAQNRAQLPVAELPAGSGAMTIVPVQMSPSTWGCYLLDPQAQVICIYQYVPGERLLKLQAARNIAYDRKLGAFNTSPLPREVADLLSKEASGIENKPTQPENPTREPGR